jgi:Tfp pilus assembly pilus retraction ATPase PilT
MKIELTEEQIISLEKALRYTYIEEKELINKRERGEYVDGWDFVGIDNERESIKEALSLKYVII